MIGIRKSGDRKKLLKHLIKVKIREAKIQRMPLDSRLTGNTAST